MKLSEQNEGSLEYYCTFAVCLTQGALCFTSIRPCVFDLAASGPFSCPFSQQGVTKLRRSVTTFSTRSVFIFQIRFLLQFCVRTIQVIR